MKRTRGNKYGAVKSTFNGIVFDSKAEAAFYSYLLGQEKFGRIQKIELQKKFTLYAGIKYVCDFVVTVQGVERYLDVKGVETATFRLKKRLFEKDYGPLEVVKASYKGGCIYFDWNRVTE